MAAGTAADAAQKDLSADATDSRNKGEPVRQRKLKMGWLMGLEPTTTGITIRDSTN